MDNNAGKRSSCEEGPRAPSVSAVARFKKPLVEYLLSGLEEEDKWVRILAVDLLGSIGDTRAIPALEPLLADRDPDIRTIASRALSRIQDFPDPETISSPGSCGSCMIRLIAEEALRKNRTGK